jgi:Holliday junction resolvasome RuvABC ATP-dependent DNA helicase subunit
MSFYQNIVGQKQIIEELTKLTKVIEKGENLNILLKAQSGYGKTTIGTAFIWETLSKLDAEWCYYVPDKENGTIEFDERGRFQFIDEIHKLKSCEFLYPLMDSRKYTFVLATNKFGGLEDALSNRCFSLIFKEYNESELIEITKMYLKLPYNDEILDIIIESGNRVPREIQKLCERLNYYFLGTKPKTEEVKSTIENVFGIRNGLNDLHIKYLNYLKLVKIAGLDTIAYGIKLDREIIKKEIEPNLIAKGLITITSRGRKIIERLFER